MAFIPHPLPHPVAPRLPHALSSRSLPPTMTAPNPSSTPSPTPSPTPRRRRKPSPHSVVARMTHLARVRDLPALDAFVAASVARGFVLNAVNYTLLANARLSAGDAPGARRVFDDMRAASVPPTNGTMRTALRCADDVVDVVDWFRDEGGEDGEVKSFNMCLGKLRERQGEMMRVWRTMIAHGGAERGGFVTVPRPDVYSFNTVLSACRRGGDYDTAMGVLGRLLTATWDVRPDAVTWNIVLGFLIDATAEQRERGTQIIALLLKMKRCDLRPDIVTHVLLLRAATICHRDISLTSRVEPPLTVSDRFGRSMQRLGLSPLGEGANNAAAAAAAAADAPLPQRSFYSVSATRLLRSLWHDARSTLSLDARYYNTLIAAFARVGDIPNALAAFREMRDTDGVRADLFTYNALLSAASHGGDVKFALRLLESLKKSKWHSADMYSYSAALSACRNDEASSKAVLAEAVASGLHITPTVLNAALQCYGGRVERAIEVWIEWRTVPEFADSVGHVDVYRSLLRSAGRAGMPQVGLKVLISGRKRGEIDPSVCEGLFGSFTRGMREAGQVQAVRSSIISKQYLDHLQLECRAFSESAKKELPFERIRIKW